MHPIGAASAAWVFAATSKVPFYVLGASLAAWAVLLAFTGVRNPGFPGSRLAARGVMLMSAALVAATVAAAIVTASGPEEHEARATAGASATGAALELTADSTGVPKYDRTELTATAGRVTIDFANPSSTPHNVTVAKGDQVVAQTKTITGGDASLATELSPGAYVFYCSVDAHRQAGMEGKLTVR